MSLHRTSHAKGNIKTPNTTLCLPVAVQYQDGNSERG